MTAAVGVARSLDIGRVASGTFAAIGRNPVVFGVLGLIFAGVPRFGLQWEILQAQQGATGVLQYAGLIGLLLLVTTFLLQGALTYATVADLNGRRPSIGECLSNGLRAFLPLIGLSILIGIALLFGFLLLIVPGVLMALAWSVAVPSLVVERKGVFGAFQRSADLTRGHRGAILLIGVVFWVLSIVVGVVLGVIVGVAVGLGHLSAGAEGLTGVLRVTTAVTQALASALEGIIGSAGIATIYYELRSIKEGAGPQDLAAVFD